MITSRVFAGRRYAVLGLARSGLATVEALIASGAGVTAWDDREEARDDAMALGADIGNPLDIDLIGFAGGEKLAVMTAAHVFESGTDEGGASSTYTRLWLGALEE